MIIEVKNMMLYRRRLEQNNIPFMFIQTLQTQTLITDEYTFKYVSSDNKLNNYELSLIKKVKNHCLNCDNIPNTVPDDLDYIDVSKVINKNVTYTSNLYELDLSSAYWNNAFKNNFISEEIYNYGLKKQISKKGRLISLGALAKNSHVQYFNGDTYELKPSIKSKTAGIFFECAKMISLEMNLLKIIAGDSYLFFWVDAIFFQGEETKIKLERYLNSKKLKYKIMELQKISVNKDDANITVYCETHKNHPKPRMYNFTKNKKKKILIMSNTLIKYICKDESKGIYFSTFEFFKPDVDVKNSINNVPVISISYEEKKKYIYQCLLENKYTNSIMNLEFNVNTESQLNDDLKNYLQSYKLKHKKIKILNYE